MDVGGLEMRLRRANGSARLTKREYSFAHIHNELHALEFVLKSGNRLLAEGYDLDSQQWAARHSALARLNSVRLAVAKAEARKDGLNWLEEEEIEAEETRLLAAGVPSLWDTQAA